VNNPCCRDHGTTESKNIGVLWSLFLNPFVILLLENVCICETDSFLTQCK
jgi:hypothetical protein